MASPLRRRIEKLMAKAGERRLKMLWMDYEQTPDEVMREHFGEAGPPPGVDVKLFCWGDHPCAGKPRPMAPTRDRRDRDFDRQFGHDTAP